MLKITFDPEKLIAALETAGARVIAALTEKTTELMFRLQSKIVSEKLSGQQLAHRTGKLASSIRAFPAELQGTSIVGKVEGAGGVAPYGAYFESGGEGPYEIIATRAQALHFFSGGHEYFRKSVMHPAIQQRAFMQPSLDEFESTIRAELESVLSKELNS